MKCYVIKVFLKCRYQVCSNPKPLINSFRALVTSAKISLQQNMYRANDALKPGDGLEICMQHSELFFIFFFGSILAVYMVDFLKFLCLIFSALFKYVYRSLMLIINESRNLHFWTQSEICNKYKKLKQSRDLQVYVYSHNTGKNRQRFNISSGFPYVYILCLFYKTKEYCVTIRQNRQSKR